MKHEYPITGLNVSSDRLSELMGMIREIAENTDPESIEQLMDGTYIHQLLQPRFFELAKSDIFNRDEALAISYMIPKILGDIHDAVEKMRKRSAMNAMGAMAEAFFQQMMGASPDGEEGNVKFVPQSGPFGFINDNPNRD